MDFMNVSNSFPVRYRFVELEHEIAHYSAGSMWAEPSIDHASEMMRYVFEHRDEAAKRGERARADILSGYSTDAIGKLTSERLAVIAKRWEFQALKRALAKPIQDAEPLLEQFAGLKEYLPEDQLRYQQLKDKLRGIVKSLVPSGATLLVISKGDDELLRFDTCRAWHFPLEAGNRYAGHYPKDSAGAIEHLEEVHARGVDFLLIPNTAFWWLDHYDGFRDHLLTHYKVAHKTDSCVMFDLRTGNLAG
jgi:hypothetical protein